MYRKRKTGENPRASGSCGSYGKQSPAIISGQFTARGVGRVPASCPPGFQGRYTVQSGDTMFFIAQRFGVSLQALINANPQIADPNVLFPGDVLCVPGVGAPPTNRVPASCPPGFQGRYTVVSGDTMFFIAQRFGVSLQALINANPQIPDPNVLFPGDVLCVPGGPPTGRVPASCPPGFQGRYTVQSGDSMFSIAQQCGVSLQALINANPHITDPNQIFPCDVLCVPCPQPGRVPTSCPSGFQAQYTVRPGDSMFSIAQRFGVSLQALINANPHITDPNQINPCDVLCVPCVPVNVTPCFQVPVGGRVPTSCPPGFQGRYTVQSGDTMFSIAQQCGVSLQALINANPHITDPNQLFPCDVLCVPCPQPGRVPTSCPSGFQAQYTVRPGDSMFSIAQLFGVSLQALINANPHITDPNQIFPCDVLCVPCVPVRVSPCFSVPVGGRVPKACPKGFRGRYTVQSGDSMFSIAQQCGVSLQALINANPHITDPNQLFPCDVLCVPCSQPGRVPKDCPKGFEAQYTVRPGDSMFSIAQRFGVSLQALINANPHIPDPKKIKPCDVLCVPCVPVKVSPCFQVSLEGRVPTSCPQGFRGRYTVVAGDTMSGIAQRYGVSLQALIAANPQITDPNQLFPCDVLCVPCPQPGRVPTSCPQGFQGQYTAVPGDSMFSIAQRFGVSLQALINANPHITDPSQLFPCDVLCVPCSASSTAAEVDEEEMDEEEVVVEGEGEERELEL